MSSEGEIVQGLQMGYYDYSGCPKPQSGRSDGWQWAIALGKSEVALQSERVLERSVVVKTNEGGQTLRLLSQFGSLRGGDWRSATSGL